MLGCFAGWTILLGDKKKYPLTTSRTFFLLECADPPWYTGVAERQGLISGLLRGAHLQQFQSAWICLVCVPVCISVGRSFFSCGQEAVSPIHAEIEAGKMLQLLRVC